MFVRDTHTRLRQINAVSARIRSARDACPVQWGEHAAAPCSRYDSRRSACCCRTSPSVVRTRAARSRASFSARRETHLSPRDTGSKAAAGALLPAQYSAIGRLYPWIVWLLSISLTWIFASVFPLLRLPEMITTCFMIILL